MHPSVTSSVLVYNLVLDITKTDACYEIIRQTGIKIKNLTHIIKYWVIWVKDMSENAFKIFVASYTQLSVKQMCFLIKFTHPTAKLRWIQGKVTIFFFYCWKLSSCGDSLTPSPNRHSGKFGTSVAVGFINSDCRIRTFHFIFLLFFLPVLYSLYYFIDMTVDYCPCHVLMVWCLVILYFFVCLFLYLLYYCTLFTFYSWQATISY